VIGSPNFGANLSIGDTIGPFGFQFGALYSDEWVTRPNQIKRQFGLGTQSGGTSSVSVEQNLNTTSGYNQAKLGGLLTASYTPNDDHQISLRSFVYQNALDETSFSTGFVGGSGSPPARLTTLRYVQESLGDGQLAGHHKLTDWFLTDWRSVLARTEREEPDTRLSQYIQDPETGVFVFRNNDDRAASASRTTRSNG
jgi:hypothetical protein